MSNRFPGRGQTSYQYSGWFPQTFPHLAVVEPKPPHEFSSRWKDSDLVLVVENQKLHVHSLILKMASPVFEAMLSGDFKERNQPEISLPGKKAEQFVDFLRQIYPQFDYPLTLHNMEHIFLLADEYQTQTVITSCVNALQLVNVNSRNVAQVVALAQMMDCDEVRQKCYSVLNNMTVYDLRLQFKNLTLLDHDSILHTLLARTERLEECLQKLQPQLVGLLDCLLFVWTSSSSKCKMGGTPTPCQCHMSPKVNSSITERLKCPACVKAWHSMASCSRDRDRTDRYNRSSEHYYSETGMYFDENIVSVLQEMIDILKTK